MKTYCDEAQAQDNSLKRTKAACNTGKRAYTI